MSPPVEITTGSAKEVHTTMRFILILLVAVALTLTWQSTVLAGLDSPFSIGACSASAKGGQQKGSDAASGDEEPECE